MEFLAFPCAVPRDLAKNGWTGFDRKDWRNPPGVNLEVRLLVVFDLPAQRSDGKIKIFRHIPTYSDTNRLQATQACIKFAIDTPPPGKRREDAGGCGKLGFFACFGFQ